MGIDHAFKQVIAISLLALSLFSGGQSWAGGVSSFINTPAEMTSLAATSELKSVARAGDRIVAVGSRGRIVVSDDEGVSWRQVPAPVSADLVSVSFVTSNVGWAVGHAGVALKTTDGGLTWKKKLDGDQLNRIMVEKYTSMKDSANPEVSDWLNDAKRFSADGAIQPLLDVWFRNEDEGYVVGVFNMIFHTTDGGDTWETWYDLTENPFRYHLNAIDGNDQEVYIASEAGLLLRLEPQTQRFVAVETPYEGSFFSVALSEDSVIVSGLRGYVIRGSDLGARWENLAESRSSGSSVTASSSLPNGDVVLVDLAGRVLIWHEQSEQITALDGVQVGSLFDITSIGSGKVALAGPRGVNVVSLQ